jgi:hypothetical protein
MQLKKLKNMFKAIKPLLLLLVKDEKKKMDPLDELEPKIQGLKKDNPFKVPDHYFDSLGVRISDRVQALNIEKTVSVPLFSKLRPILIYSTGFAGVAIILYFGISIFFTKHHTNTPLTSQEMANNYEYSLVSGIDDATLIDNLSQETKTMNDSVGNRTEKDHIIDYLVKEDIDMNTIIDAL